MSVWLFKGTIVSKTLEALESSRPWIRHIDDERGDVSSIIVTLAKGYDFADDPGCGVKGFDTVAEVRDGTRKADVVTKAADAA
jgi:hypothetical protein